MNVAFAITAAMFAALFLAPIMVFGGEFARNIAILAAFFGCISQFSGQDPASYRLSIYAAYAAFMTGLFSYIALILGH